jgi:hypothetical protein
VTELVYIQDSELSFVSETNGFVSETNGFVTVSLRVGLTGFVRFRWVVSLAKLVSLLVSLTELIHKYLDILGTDFEVDICIYLVFKSFPSTFVYTGYTFRVLRNIIRIIQR